MNIEQRMLSNGLALFVYVWGECKMLLVLASIENKEVRSYLEKLYYDYKKVSYSKALSIVKNQDDAQDVVQQVYANIAEYLDCNKNVDIKNKNAFISEITRNVSLDFLKKQRLHVDINEIDELENVTFIDPEVNVLRMDQIKEHTKNLEQLNQDYANIIMFKYTQEMSISEIAKIMNLSEDTARRKLSRARKAFKSILNEGEKYA